MSYFESMAYLHITVHQPIQHYILHNSFWLSADRCLYWEEENALIVADLHLGKTGHFRKSGIAIPQNIFKEDLQRLVNCLQFFNPKQLIVIGDLFHSEANKELDLFKKWRKDFSSLIIHLIKGNHDILDDDWYNKAGIEITNEELRINNFCFRHDLAEVTLTSFSSQLYFFSGHIHPGIYINGTAKQSLRFPCFYFTKQFAVLPAFSRFTGTHLINPQKGETIYAVVDTRLVQVV
jgi:DNA ligase-associated metallophosphoesterase